MSKALIGYTGFVGGNLDAQTNFDFKYNSKNISEIDGKEFDLVVCSAARAEKWRINQEPEKDLEEINSLIEHLKTIKTKKLVLISTVDVYKLPVNVDESTEPEKNDLHPYGLNRLHLEEFCKNNFNTLIVRLPGLFGPGLKKNVIYDLLNDNNVEKIHHAGTFQYYNLENIWNDIEVVLSSEINLINFATEPVRTDEIAKICFGIDFDNVPDGVNAGLYDMHTTHAGLFSKTGNYIYSKDEVIQDIKAFVEKEKAKKSE